MNKYSCHASGAVQAVFSFRIRWCSIFFKDFARIIVLLAVFKEGFLQSGGDG